MTLGQATAGRDLKTRLLWLGGVMLVGLLVLSVRLYRLQITRGDEFVQRSVANALKEVRIPADRGMILDSRREILVDNRPSFDVVITPAFCQHCYDEVLPQLATYLGWDPAQQAKIEAQLRAVKRNAVFQPLTIWIDLTRDDPERVKLDTLNAHKLELPGVDVVQAPHRNYRTVFVDKDKKPSNGLAHLLGYMNEINEDELDRLNATGAHYQLGDYIGRRGLERYYESVLRGTDGKRDEVVDARGEPLPMLDALLGASSTVEQVPGHNLVLSIDARLQQAAETAFPGVAGGVVAMEVKTGFILAMFSRPAFDPNLMTGRVSPAQLDAMSKDPLQPMIFRPVQQQYPPGSTFKLVTLLAGLRSGQFNAHSAFHCSGSYRLGNRAWRCFKESGHGTIEPRQAIQQSCDAFFYHMGDVLGLDPIGNMGLELGLGAPTGINVVAEVPGIIPTVAYHDRVTPGGYTKGMAINSSVGQGDVNVTPLQLVRAYATIANGGTLYQPQVVRRIETLDGQVIQEFEPKVMRRVEIPPEHRQLAIEGLTDVVNAPGGTAYRARLKDIKMAGKTGTAQVKRLGAVRLKAASMDYWARDNAWFVAFAPVEDPEIAVVVINEHAGFGGTEPAPTAAAVIQKYFDLKKEGEPAFASATVVPPSVAKALVAPTPVRPVKALPVKDAPAEAPKDTPKEALVPPKGPQDVPAPVLEQPEPPPAPPQPGPAAVPAPNPGIPEAPEPH